MTDGKERKPCKTDAYAIAVYHNYLPTIGEKLTIRVNEGIEEFEECIQRVFRRCCDTAK